MTRQEKAAKLNTCQCDGFEEYDCKGIHRNMNLLCFGKIHHGYRDVNIEDDRRNKFLTPNTSLRGDGVQILVNRKLFLFSLIIYHIFKIKQGKIVYYNKIYIFFLIKNLKYLYN